MSDRLSFNPHIQFVRGITDADRAAYRQTMLQPHVKAAFTSAVAEMTRRGHTREELDGALAFIDLFQNFAEQEVEPKKFPVKTLQPT